MKVTKVCVRMRTASGYDSKIRAYADFVLDDEFSIHGAAIIAGDNGLYVGMPFRVDPNSKRARLEICHSVTEEGRLAIQGAILDQYNVLLRLSAVPG